MSVSTDSLDVTEVAEHSLLPVPDSARTSTAAHQFWIWTGANIAPINWVLGALGIQLGLSLWQTIGVLVAGNVLGMAVFGFFVLMGQRTGGEPDGAVAVGVRPPWRLPAGRHAGPAGRGLVRGQHLDRARPGGRAVRQGGHPRRRPA